MNSYKLRNKSKSEICFRIALGTTFAALFSGCASFDFLPWVNQGRVNTSATKQSGIDNKSFVFNLPPRDMSPSSVGKAGAAILPADNYPFQAPGIRLPTPRLEVNHEVRRELTNYLRNNARCISEGLARQENLFPVLAKIFHDEGLPDELLNLALIESGFRVEASSPVGAVGLWQFMSGTARLYGLEVSKRVDERRDPIISTMAAAHLLKGLYSKYNDWYLVLAAYNAGEGTIDRVTQGTSRADYWKMVRTNSINSETARFVPKFIAAAILQKLYIRYGSQVQLAQYVDRHVVAVSDAGLNKRFAFSMESELASKIG